MLENFTLLYVEDNEEMQDYVKIFLQNRVKKFYQAYDGKEGVKLFKEKSPDIVLTDICLPELDGLDMAQEIKNLDKQTNIIAISAFDNKEILIKAINIGVDYFIPKPINFEILLNRLNIIAQNLQDRLYVKKAKEKELHNLKQLAYYDNLTGILNRTSFEENLEYLTTSTDNEFSVFFIDLDNFKTINDTYGHKNGDRVLQNTVSNINKIIRNNDIFARLSGDEFAVVIKNVEKSILDNIAQKIIESVKETMIIDDEKVNIGCSIGISIFPKDGKIKKDLIHFADLAMYEAKKSGKSTYKYFSNTKG